MKTSPSGCSGYLAVLEIDQWHDVERAFVRLLVLGFAGLPESNKARGMCGKRSSDILMFLYFDLVVSLISS